MRPDGSTLGPSTVRTDPQAARNAGHPREPSAMPRAARILAVTGGCMSDQDVLTQRLAMLLVNAVILIGSAALFVVGLYQ